MKINTKMRFTLVLFCLLITIPSFSSENAFVDGNQQFQAKNYENAAASYEIHLKEANTNRFECFHNLGNAYFRLGSYPKAILNYERALLIQPNHNRLQHNLQIAIKQTEDQFSKADSFFLSKWWQNWRDLFSVNIWSIFTILTAIISAIALGFWKLGKYQKQRKNGFLVGFSTLTLVFILLITTWQRASSITSPKTAIIMQTEVALKTASDESSPTIFMLHGGTKVNLVDELGNWQKVNLPNGDIGWLEKRSFEEI